MAENKAKKPIKVEKPIKTKKPTKAKKPIKAAKSIKAPKPTEIPKPAEVPKPVQVLDLDAYSPSQIASRIDAVALVKAKYSTAQTFWMGINAGVYIALGAQFATLVISDSTLHFGLTSIIAGIVFSLGLILPDIPSNCTGHPLQKQLQMIN